MRTIPPKRSIPANVRTPAKRPNNSVTSYTHGPRPLPKMTLAKLLEWGQHEEQKCLDLLKVLPYDMPEYNEVMTKLDQLRERLIIIKQQTRRQK